MGVKIGDTVKMKKQHPCGCDTFKVTRIGMDFKLVCTQCGREVMMPRKAAERLQSILQTWALTLSI